MTLLTFPLQQALSVSSGIAGCTGLPLMGVCQQYHSHCTILLCLQPRIHLPQSKVLDEGLCSSLNTASMYTVYMYIKLHQYILLVHVLHINCIMHMNIINTAKCTMHERQRPNLPEKINGRMTAG